MWLIFICYLLMASTFTFAKTAIFYMKPIYFIALRMIIAGSLLLGYLHFFRKHTLVAWFKDLKLFLAIIFFHIYAAYIFEFLALQYIASYKVCLLYSLTPFITALLCYLLFQQKLTMKKWIALILGFLSMFPVFISGKQGVFTIISSADLILLFAIACASYGWIIMKELVVNKEYSPVLVNGIGMFFGGVLALGTALFFEGTQPFIINESPSDLVGKLLMPYWGSVMASMAMAFICMFALIIIANILGYNLYGYLLRFYSATFLAFAGLITPFFASIFGWLFLSEKITINFLLALSLTTVSLYLFYQEELTGHKNK